MCSSRQKPEPLSEGPFQNPLDEIQELNAEC
jgi:hypothetical protein